VYNLNNIDFWYAKKEYLIDMKNVFFLKIVGVIFAIISFLLLGFSWHLYTATRNFLETGIITSAEVIELKKSDEGTFAPVFVYIDLKGQHYEKVSSFGSSPPSYKVGEIIEVVYDESNPYEAKILSFISLWPPVIICLILGIAFLFATVLIIKADWEKEA